MSAALLTLAAMAESRIAAVMRDAEAPRGRRRMVEMDE